MDKLSGVVELETATLEILKVRFHCNNFNIICNNSIPLWKGKTLTWSTAFLHFS